MPVNKLSTNQVSKGRNNELVPLPKGHPQYLWVEKCYDKGWQHPNKPKPPIQAIYEIVLAEDKLRSYENYRGRVADSMGVSTQASKEIESLLFHGTNRSCLLAENKDRTIPCKLSDCYLCGVVGSSFDIEKCGIKNKFRRFGTGIYTTSCSSKADDYVVNAKKGATYNVLLGCRVCTGKPYILRSNQTQLTKPPHGYHSIKGETGVHLNYPETVVYDNDAIRPGYLVVYGFPSDKGSSTILKLFRTPVAA